MKRFRAPSDADFLLERNVCEGVEMFHPAFVEKRVQLDGAGIENAKLSIDPYAGKHVVDIQFARADRKKFATVTALNVGRCLAIVLDGDLLSTPEIREPIVGGNAVITGRFTADEARRLVAMLNSGELPCRVTIASERSF